MSRVGLASGYLFGRKPQDEMPERRKVCNIYIYIYIYIHNIHLCCKIYNLVLHINIQYLDKNIRGTYIKKILRVGHANVYITQ